MFSREAVPTGSYINPELDAMHDDVAGVLSAARRNGVTRGNLNISTGCGKTRIAANDVNAYLAENPDARVLYLCHDTNILSQAGEEFASVLGSQVDIGNIYGGSIDGHETKVTMASFQQLNQPINGADKDSARLYELISPDSYDYVVVDESHHGPAETYRQVIEHLNPKFLLGLTATPDRRDMQDISELFGDELYRVTLEEAIIKGYVCPIDYRVFSRGSDVLSQENALGKGVSLGQHADALFVKLQDEEIVARINEQVADISDPRMVVFCQNIDEAERFAELLPGAASSYHSRMQPRDQAECLQAFRDGKIQTLSVVDKLNEGVDVPEVNVVAFVRATESQTVYLQQLGRGSRWASGKDSLLVLDFVANYNRIKFIEYLRTRLEHQARSGKAHNPSTRATPFKFNYSAETVDVLGALSRARAKRSEQSAEKQQESQQQKDDRAIEALTGVALPKETQFSTARQMMLLERIKAGDRQAESEYILRRYRTIYNAIKNIPEIEGFTLDDYFQIGCTKLLEFIRSADIQNRTAAAVYVTVSNGVNAALRENGIHVDYATKTKTFSPLLDTLSLHDNMLSNRPADDNALERVERNITERKIYIDALGSLSTRELMVLVLRKDEHTLDVIGERLGVSRDRVRQIENGALRTLMSHVKRSPIISGSPVVVSQDEYELATARSLGYDAMQPLARRTAEFDYLLEEGKPMPKHEEERYERSLALWQQFSRRPAGRLSEILRANALKRKQHAEQLVLQPVMQTQKFPPSTALQHRRAAEEKQVGSLTHRALELTIGELLNERARADAALKKLALQRSALPSHPLNIESVLAIRQVDDATRRVKRWNNIVNARLMSHRE